MNVYKLTSYRSILMGLSIIWIILFHLVGIIDMPNPFRSFQAIGYLGVDIFFFVSAYGLYYSMGKNPDISLWYKKRIIRICPAFLIVTLFFNVVRGSSFLEILGDFASVNFFLPFIDCPISYWYVPSCLVFYAVFPLIYRNREIICRYIFFFVIFFFAFALFMNWIKEIFNLSPFYFFFLYRIPIFLLGLVYAMVENRILEHRKCLLTMVFIAIGCLFVMLKTSTEHFIFRDIQVHELLLLIFSLPFFFALSAIVKFKGPYLNRILTYCGTYSFEIYLLHTFCLYLFSIHLAINNMLAILVSLFFVIFISRYLSMFVKIITVRL